MERLEINYKIHDLRRKNKLSGREFAEKISQASGVEYTRSDVNNWEMGYRIKDDDLYNICQAFNVSADSLLFKGPSFKYRSDDQEVVDSANFTGLSHKAVAMLHELQSLGYDLNALSFLLEQVQFYRVVLNYLNDALRYINGKDDDDITIEQAEAIDYLMTSGFRIETPYEAFSSRSQACGNGLTSMLTQLHECQSIPSLSKYIELQNDSFINSLKELQTSKDEEEK